MNKSYEQAIFDGNIEQNKKGVVGLQGDNWTVVKAEILARRYSVTAKAMYNYLIKSKLTIGEIFDTPISEVIEGILNAN